MVPHGSAAASHLWLIASCPWRGHWTCPHTAAHRRAQPPSGRPSPSPASGGILLPRLFFALQEIKGSEYKHPHLPSKHIQPNMRGIFIVEGSDL